MAKGEESELRGGGGLYLGFSTGGNEANYAMFDNIRIIDFMEQEPEQTADLTKLQDVYDEGRI